MLILNKIETNDLIVQLKAREKNAFSVLYDNYSAALLGVATKIVRDQQVAEDVLQEVYVKIWRCIDTYDASKGTLFTWMLHITQNTSKDYLRSKQYHYQLQIVGNGLESVDAYAVDWQPNRQDESHEIQSLVRNLETKYREIIDLIYICGHTQIEVAEILNIPSGTVKTRCRAALRKLKSIYTP